MRCDLTSFRTTIVKAETRIECGLIEGTGCYIWMEIEFEAALGHIREGLPHYYLDYFWSILMWCVTSDSIFDISVT